MKTKNIKIKKRLKRAKRIRFHLKSRKSTRARLIIRKSNQALLAQIADPNTKQVIWSHKIKGKSIPEAGVLAQKIIEFCNLRKIKEMVFDRGGYKYHGVVKAVGDLIRDGGIKI